MSFARLPNYLATLSLLGLSNASLAWGHSDAALQELPQPRFSATSFHELMSSYYDHTAEPIPWTLFGYAALAYHASPNFRIVYHQRMTGDFYADRSGESDFQAMDPRIALRYERTHPFHQSLDVYIQPGVFGASRKAGRIGNLGIRFNLGFSSGAVSGGGFVDTGWNAYESTGTGPDFSGMASVWLGGKLTSRLSTQHALFIAWQKRVGTGIEGLAWDFPYRPIVQNGLNLEVSDAVWLAVLLNHSLVNPVLNRLWMSVWLGSAFR